jgi:hypothetical protein
MGARPRDSSPVRLRANGVAALAMPKAALAVAFAIRQCGIIEAYIVGRYATRQTGRVIFAALDFFQVFFFDFFHFLFFGDVRCEVKGTRGCSQGTSAGSHCLPPHSWYRPIARKVERPAYRFSGKQVHLPRRP